MSEFRETGGLKNPPGRLYASAMIPYFLALADDLTGALEVGAAFAEAGIESSVSTECEFEAAACAGATPGLVIDTETRHLDARKAFERVQALAAAAAAAGVRFQLKKTDSTLRGNVAAELSGLAAALAPTPLIYLPAYPQLRRTVRDGILYVDGRPVSRTEFGADRLNPVSESHIPTLLAAAGSPMKVVALRPQEIDRARDAAIYVIDGETDADVHSCAEALADRIERFALAGPAGPARRFARAITRRGYVPRTRSVAQSRVTSRTALIINGSLHPVSESQVRHAVAAGAPVAGPDDVPAAVRQSRWVVLETAAHGQEDGLDVARTLGRTVAGILRRTAVDALVVFGGDTLFGIVAALGFPVLRSVGEVFPGVAAARISGAALADSLPGRVHDLVVVSKAGGFGGEDVLARIRGRLLKDDGAG